MSFHEGSGIGEHLSDPFWSGHERVCRVWSGMVAAATREINLGTGLGIVETNPKGNTFFITVLRITDTCG